MKKRKPGTRWLRRDTGTAYCASAGQFSAVVWLADHVARTWRVSIRRNGGHFKEYRRPRVLADAKRIAEVAMNAAESRRTALLRELRASLRASADGKGRPTP